MPYKFENFAPNWDDIENECQHFPLNCPWTITSENDSNRRHYLLEMDLQLFLLDKSDCPSRKKPKYFETNRQY